MVEYPESFHGRNRWITAMRPATDRNLPVYEPSGFLLEEEPLQGGEVASVFTVFLTNRECPWRCVMCDLWRHTTTNRVPAGSTPKQIEFALSKLESNARSASPIRTKQHLKLYNSGSFFDASAVDPGDHDDIARLCRGFDRVIIECHPRLIDERAIRFLGRLRAASQNGKGPELEIAIGLETAHEETLSKLNKGFDLRTFNRAANFLHENDIALRVFLLVQPPFLPPSSVLDWTQRSVEHAIRNHASTISLIPTRSGNGAMDKLQTLGFFTPPTMTTLEECHDAVLSLTAGHAILLADTWGISGFSECVICSEKRVTRIQRMNLDQHILPRVNCEHGALKQ